MNRTVLFSSFFQLFLSGLFVGVSAVWPVGASGQDCNNNGTPDTDETGGGDLRFDQIQGQIVTAETLEALPNFGNTVSLWFKTDHSDTGLFQFTDFTNTDGDIFLEDGAVCSRVVLPFARLEEIICSESSGHADDEWHQVTRVIGSFPGTVTTHRLFIDGEIVAKGAYGASKVDPQGVLIGLANNSGGGGISFDGHMDDVRIWFTPLNEAEVATNFDVFADPPRLDALLAHYRFDEFSGQEILDSAPLEGSNDGFLGSGSGPSSDDPIRTQIGLLPNPDCPLAVDCNLNSLPDTFDLTEFMSIDCNVNNVPDECDLATGTSGDCNANGTPDECEAEGWALAFNGSELVLPTLDVSEGPYSASLWFKTTNPDCGLYAVADASFLFNNDRQLYLQDGAVCGQVLGDAGSETVCSSSMNWADDQWHQVTQVLGLPDGHQLYLDGQLVGSGILVESSFDEQTKVIVGNSASAASPRTEGQVDDVRIWNAALNDAEVAANFDVTVAPPQSDQLLVWYRFDEFSGQDVLDSAPLGGFNNTFLGFVATQDSDDPGRVTPGIVPLDETIDCNDNDMPDECEVEPVALKFNGSEVVNQTVLDVSEGPYTASLWFKTSCGDCGLYSVCNNAFDCDRDLYLREGAVCTNVLPYPPSGHICSSSFDYADDEWHQVTHVLTGVEGQGMQLYVDGVLVTEFDIEASIYTDQFGVRIGYANQATEGLGYAEGLIDDVRIWNVALSAEEVVTNFDVNAEPPRIDELLAWYRFDELVGQEVLDSAPLGGFNNCWLGNEADFDAYDPIRAFSGVISNGSIDTNSNDIPDECEVSSCEGDANGDGAVDPLDSGYVLARFGCSVGAGDPACDAADQNGDHFVDPLDVGYVLSRFGVCP